MPQPNLNIVAEHIQSFMTTVCHPMAASSKITLPVRQQLHDDIMSLRTKISLILLFVYFWNMVWHGSIVKVSQLSILAYSDERKCMVDNWYTLPTLFYLSVISSTSAEVRDFHSWVYFQLSFSRGSCPIMFWTWRWAWRNNGISLFFRFTFKALFGCFLQ